MLSSVFVLLATVAPAMGRPYLEFCSLVDYTQNGHDGVSISALCGDANALRCQTLDIDPCFTNSGGYLVPAQNSSGHFGSLCTECTLGMSKSNTEEYGRLRCLCRNKSMNSTTRTSILTGSVINYEADYRMACGPRNSTAARSVACTPTVTSRYFNDTAWAMAMRRFDNAMHRFNDTTRRVNDTMRIWGMHRVNETERNMAMNHSNGTQRIVSMHQFNESALHDRRIRTSQDEHNHWLLG